VNDGLKRYLFYGLLGLNIDMKLDLVVIICRLFIVINGSGLCTHHRSLLFVVDEISHNKVVVMEGAAGLRLSDHFYQLSFHLH